MGDTSTIYMSSHTGSRRHLITPIGPQFPLAQVSAEGRGQHGRLRRKGDRAAVHAHILLRREGHPADSLFRAALALAQGHAMLKV